MSFKVENQGGRRPEAETQCDGEKSQGETSEAEDLEFMEMLAEGLEEAWEEVEPDFLEEWVE